MIAKVIILLILPGITYSKTVSGTFTTDQAKLNFGQYVTGFYFHGRAMVKHIINATTNGFPKLYFYVDESWKEAKGQDCQNKLLNAKFQYNLNVSKGNRTIDYFENPHIWHIVYVDDFTCEQGRPISPLELPNYIQFEIQLLNLDSFGEPTNHFSKEEDGLKTYYQFITLIYFIVACIYSPILVKKLNEYGPMTSMIKLISMSMILQSVCAFFMFLHLYRYSKDGIGATWMELLSEFLDMVSQFIMLYMLLSLSLGWTLGGTYKPSSFDALKKRPAAQVVGGLAILQGILFLWEQLEEHSHKMYHAHRSVAGLVLVLVRMALAALFAWNLYDTVKGERSATKRGFYMTFAKSCMLWFLCYPVLVVISWILADYTRYKFITVGVMLGQSVCVIMLYRLFLSQSLFWEVSALSSSLPLRMDKSFTKPKAYS